MQRNDTDENFQYDAFVSYADEDNDFVNHVVTQLESSGFRLLFA